MYVHIYIYIHIHICYDYCCGRSLYLFEKLNIFLISNFFRVLNVVFCLLGEFSAADICADVSEHSACSIFTGGVSRKNAYTACDDGIECSETSAHKIQTPRIHPKDRIQQLNI